MIEEVRMMPRALGRALFFRSGFRDHVSAEIERQQERERKKTAKLEEQLRHVQEQQREILSRLKELTRAVQETRLEPRLAALEQARHSDQRDRLEALTADLARTFPVPALQAHARAVIARSPLETDPYPHVVLDGILPDAFHTRLVQARPPHGYWHSGQVGRENWTIGEDLGPLETEATWRYMDDVVAPQVLTPELTAVFRDYLRTLHGDTSEPVPHEYETSGGRLMLRRPGYQFEPHLDPHRAMLTALLYFGGPEDSRDFGTMLYRTDRPLPKTHRGVYYPLREGATCELVKTVPSRPNSMLVFASRIGLHGAAIPADAQPPTLQRYTYQFYIGNARDDRGAEAQGAVPSHM